MKKVNTHDMTLKVENDLKNNSFLPLPHYSCLIMAGKSDDYRNSKFQNQPLEG